MSKDGGFLARWSRRKQQAKQSEAVPAVATGPAASPHPIPLPVGKGVVQAEARTSSQPDGLPSPHGSGIAGEGRPTADQPPPPTLADVAKLGADSDFAPFVQPGVDDDVKRAALKKLFSDPHFNRMDGLDVYIDDYSKPDPIPASMLRQLAQSKFLGLFDDEVPPVPPAPAASPDGAPGAVPASSGPIDENADLRLQPDDAARPEGAGDSAEGDPRRVG